MLRKQEHPRRSWRRRTQLVTLAERNLLPIALSACCTATQRYDQDFRPGVLGSHHASLRVRQGHVEEVLSHELRWHRRIRRPKQVLEPKVFFVRYADDSIGRMASSVMCAVRRKDSSSDDLAAIATLMESMIVPGLI